MTSLILLTFLPLIGALVVALTPGENKALIRTISMVTALAAAAMGVAVFLAFDGSTAEFQMTQSAAWFELPGRDGPIPIALSMGVDGISILLVALTTVLMPIVVLSTRGHITERVKEFFVWLLVMETGMLGVFLSLDLVLFYFFWEVSLVPLYFILGIWGGERRLYATVKFFLYTVAGSLVMLIAAISMIYRFGTTDVVELTQLAGALPSGEQLWLFLGFALAFAIKVPVIPFHTWLADAHTEAPTSGSVILAGVLLKMGTYGLLRFGIAMFPAAAVQCAPAFMALGAFGILYGALLAWAQSDVKRLVACSSVSHLGYVVLGLFAMTAAGLRGSLIQMVNHGLSTGMLFLLIGMIYERRHTRALDQYGGVAAVMPVYALLFIIAVLSSVGLPGLNGFVGEYMILLGTFEASPLFAVVGVTGVIFGAVYLLMATRRMLFGPVTHEENKKLKDVAPRELWSAVPLVVFMVWIGVAPGIFLDRTAASVDKVVQAVEAARGEALGLADKPAADAVALSGQENEGGSQR